MTPRTSLRPLIAAVIALAIAVAPAVPADATPRPAAAGPAEPVIFVGNNWAGTVQVIRQRGYTTLGQVNAIPDFDQRMAEILADPVRLAFFLAIRMGPGEGHDQFVDDMYSSPDGTLLVASRPSFADVVGIDLRTGRIVWRFRVAGQRSDHMGLSPDGTRVAVSASTERLVHVLDVRTGRELGRFPSGDTPHENTYSRDGSRIFHASIGTVYTPIDHPAFDTTKGERVFEVVDAASLRVLEKIDLRPRLDAAGHTELSSAIRPMAHTADERFFYFQLSFFHGFVEYDRTEDRVTRVARLPKFTTAPREQYVNDSAHHGVAMDATGGKLCVAGTMDDYAAIVSRTTFAHRIVADRRPDSGKPYWATSSKDGRYCYVSWSGADQMSVISYRTEREVARVDVGDHPQRIREGAVPAGWTAP
ncbi:MAG: PQQ-binding-like beta-propeller repeat protein [Streptosporangiales bacterium]|nr:PQQ-binding-like beta-propeller repeat protein [Streptosporangiales bacterium]